MTVFYLHGFASSPESSKAQFFAERLAAIGSAMRCPDLNEPDFAALTVTRMLAQVEGEIARQPPGPVVLIGSSLGGFVAVELAARQAHAPTHPIERLVLLAPAVELEWDRWSEIGPGGVAAWRQQGFVELHHYAYDERRRLEYGFYEDAVRYQPSRRRLLLPMLIFQGRHDTSVSPALVEAFASRQPGAVLHLLEDGHQLKDSLDFIWQEAAPIMK